MDWPSIGVVVPTRNRPQILRSALDAIDAQSYPGRLRVVVVYDQVQPEPRLARTGARPVTVLVNARRAGLAGARNTGILALDTDLVAFCDDEDRWRPGKLIAQVEALAAAPDADLVTCAVELSFQRQLRPGLIGQTHIGLGQLARSPMGILRSSSFLARRASLVAPDRVGLFAEDAPGSQSEDWDLLLRAARRAPIEHVDEPLVRVHWRQPAHHGYEYAGRISSRRWMMTRHPEIAGCPPGTARLYGQMARWPAAAGNGRDVWRYNQSTVRNDRPESRSWLPPAGLAGLARMIRVESLLGALNRRGHAD